MTANIVRGTADAAGMEPPSEPTYAELRARILLAQSLISHRLDTENPDIAAVLAVLRGDLSLAGVE